MSAKHKTTADVIKAHGGHYADAIIRAADIEGLGLAIACALVEQESAFRNIFGGDYGASYRGRPPFYHEAVTPAKVRALLRQPLNNGVGLTQLTSRSLVEAAEKLGGAHLPLAQCRIGFRFMGGILDQYGEDGIWHYNGAPEYQAQIEPKIRAWKARFR